MNHDISNYHTQRRPFIILPEVEIIIGELGMPYSHSEILAHLGLNEAQVKNIINNYPRGYFLNNKLVLYQLDNVEEGQCWELKPENYEVVRKYFVDLQNIYQMNAETKIFLGVKRGKLGEIWETVHPVEHQFFL